MKLAIIGLGSIARKAYLPLLSSREGIELLFSSRSNETVVGVVCSLSSRPGDIRLGRTHPLGS